jgi:hypothetical protein
MEYTKEKLEELAKGFPPVGHPHYIPIEERLGLNKPKEEKPEMSSAAAAKYQALKNKIAEAKKQMEKTAKEAFTEMVTDFFEENPDLLSFGWNQYTPYWNDGDVCTFSANTDYPSVTMVIDEQEITYDENSGDITNADGDEIKTQDDYKRMFEGMKGGKVSGMSIDGKTVALDAKGVVTVDGEKVKSRDEYSKAFDKATDKVSKFLGNFDEEDLETMFGDHMQITVNRKGKITKEEYEHE